MNDSVDMITIYPDFPKRSFVLFFHNDEPSVFGGSIFLVCWYPFGLFQTKSNHDWSKPIRLPQELP